uniref:G_PROTEIN_RECEP_F1_2 domain-containing protein n=1 Tax=Steinernema glaseri TaxID=37863 RepID=A0A1I8AT63_9BILA
MAFADIGFLISMLPHCLAPYAVFYTSISFRYLYYVTKTHVNAMANLFSAAATWLVLAVSIERFIGIRKPMHTRFQWRVWKIYALIVVVFILAAAVTAYHHIEYHVKIVYLCNDRQLRALYYPVGQKVAMVPSLKIGLIGNASDPPDIPAVYALYAKWGKYLQSSTVVVMPIIAVAILNYSLIAALRKRDVLTTSGSEHNDLKAMESETTLIVSERANGSAGRKESDKIRFSDLGAIQRQERRVTITVLSIVTCFTLTHAPTLIPFVWESIDDTATRYPLFINMVSIVNNLLVVGKVMNFVLFCSVSSHFRKRMCTLLLKRPKKYSTGSTSLQSRHKHSVQLSTYRSRPRGQKFSTTSTQLDY